MKVSKLSFSLHRFPPVTPWQDATHRVTGLEFIMADLQTEAGIRGTGFTYTVGVGGSAILALLEDYCAEMLIGQDIRDYERLWRLLFDHLHRTGSGGINTLALAAIDTALWDALARMNQLPLWRALGGARSSVPGYGSGIDLFMSADELAKHVQGYLNRGYEAVKIKVGRAKLSEDLARLKIVREIIGPDRWLLLDANQCWTVDEAIYRARAFEAYQPRWLEEPLAPEDVAGHARLRASTGIPIAAGESLYTSQQFLDYLRAEAVDVLQPDVARVGGYTPWKKIAALAETWGIPVAPHFLAELSLHALCAVPNGLILENVTGGSFAELGIVPNHLPLVAGSFQAPDGVGHSLELDFDILEKHRIHPGQLRKMDTTTHLL